MRLRSQIDALLDACDDGPDPAGKTDEDRLYPAPCRIDQLRDAGKSIFATRVKLGLPSGPATGSLSSSIPDGIVIDASLAREFKPESPDA